MRHAVTVAAMVVAICNVCGCDERAKQVEQGQSAVDQARAAAGVDFDQKIDMAVNLIHLGKLEDARRLLQQLSGHEDAMSEGTKAKFAAANEELTRARQP